MVSQKRLLRVFSLIIILSLLLVACERPIPGNSVDNQDDTTADIGGDPTSGADPNAGGGAGDSSAGQAEDVAESDADTPYPPPDEDGEGAGDDSYPAPDDGDVDTDAGDTDSGDGEADTGAGDADSGDGDADTGAGDADSGDSAGDADSGDGDADTGAGDADSGEGEGDTSSESGGGTPEGGDNQTEDSSTDDSASGTTSQTHTVAAGENLYRIGLKYGISWVTLAQINNLPNPHRIYVGQVLKLVADGGDLGVGGEKPPEQDVEYLVKAGDTLFKIGKAFGVDWREIAKRNNLVNPNRILVGQKIIVPGVSSPTVTPEPQRTHVVQWGQTLFKISLQYGVPWTKIAEENNIVSPYVIYPGQTLVIPAS